MKDTTEAKEIVRAPVTLVAFDYEWTCPNCGEVNKCERTSEVTCDHCDENFPVRELAHA